MSYENIPKTDDESAVLTVPKSEAFLEMVAGRVPGRAVLHLFGRNPNISPADGFKAVWSGAGDYTGFNAIAEEELSVVSTSAADTAGGTGAQAIRIEGLDIGLNPINEILPLNGLTPVITANKYYRWSITFVVAAGSDGWNQGEITGVQSIATGNAFFHMVPLSNRCLAAVHTVPAGKVYYTNNRFASLAKKGNSASEVQVMARIPGVPFQIFEWFAIKGTGSSYVGVEFEAPLLGIPAGTDIMIAMDTDTNNSGVAAGVEFIIEDV